MAPTITLVPGTFVVQHGAKGDVHSSWRMENSRFRPGRPSSRADGARDVFGELAPSPCVRTHSVRTLTECTLAVIDGQQLREMLEMGSLGGRFVSALIARLVGSQLTEPAALDALPSVRQTHRTL